MEGYSLPYFKGVPRQRGRGIGALAATVGRNFIPILKKFIVPTAKQITKDFVQTAVPELSEVVAGRKSVRKALSSSAKQTIRKQIGSGRVTKKKKKRSRKKVTNQKSRKKRSRLDLFKNLPE